MTWPAPGSGDAVRSRAYVPSPQQARARRLPPLLTVDEIAAVRFAERVLLMHADDHTMPASARATYRVEAARLAAVAERARELR